MSMVRKNNAKEGAVVYACFDDGAFVERGYKKGVITSVFNDHYLYNEESGEKDVWGFYDYDAGDSVAVFTEESEAKAWVDERNSGMGIDY